jgi:phosphoglycerate dehydrogenase-like enzyme
VCAALEGNIVRIGFCVPMNEVWTAGVDALESRLGPEVEIIRGVDATLAAFPGLDAVVANPLDRSYYESAKTLKALFVPFVGVNHVPADLLEARGVAVYNCHGNAEAVAERSLAMVLAFFGRVIEYHNDLRTLKWHGFWVHKGREDFWHSIFRKRCTILGVGAIGQMTARLLKAFDCRVTGYRRREGLEAPDMFDSVTTDLGKALEGAEIVFVTLPLTDATRGLVGRAQMEAMRGAFLVNVGRGEVVDEEALYKSLKDGTLTGAGIDVWYTYPKDGSTTGAPSRFPVHELPNVVLSPHVGGSTTEAGETNIRQTLGNVERWALTGDSVNRVDLAALY